MDYAEWIAPLSKTIEGMLGYLPHLLGFLGLVLLGWILASLLRALTVRFIRGLDRLIHSRTIQDEYKQSGLDRSVPGVMGQIVFWIILFFFVTAATEALGFPVVANFLSGLAQYLPSVLAAALIGIIGFVTSGLARKGVARAAAAGGVAYPDFLGRATQTAILLIVALVIMEQIGIKIEFLMILVAMAVGTMLGGMALAFGLGAKNVVSNMVVARYLSRTYRVGQTVRIGTIQGRILEMTPMTVILDTTEGRVLLPPKEFGEQASVLITTGG